jgi:rhomboid protease GluP
VSATSPRPPPFDAGAGEGRASRAEGPLVTRTLIAVNVGVFLVQVVLSGTLALPQDTALRFGASYALATLAEARWETLVTACFLHGNVVHLAINMVFLWVGGPVLERAVGPARMAPLYLLAGAFGNAVSVAHGWFVPSGSYTIGASGAVCGVLAAALVVGWRRQGWRGRVTRAMAWWLGVALGMGLLASLLGRSVDSFTHVGGAVMGAAVALAWRLDRRYSEVATRRILSVSVGVLAGCIAAVAVHDRTDPFSSMTVQERQQFAMDAVRDGRCRDAHDGLLAVERLRGPMPSLRKPVETACGHVLGP